MQKISGARRVGAHRKVDNSAKRRVAMVAVAAGAVGSAGAAGATAGAQQSNTVENQASNQITLAADNDFLAQAVGGTDLADTDIPRILEVPQIQNTTVNLSQQLNSALEFAKQRAEADAALRAPRASSPAAGTFTSPFGARWGTIHQGIDIANAIGTAINAVKDGTVIDAGPAAGFGNWIRILHDNGDITVYGHMSTVEVAVGEKITAGQRIAGMGNEGFSTGSHLHFEIHPGGGSPIDPVPWLADLGIHVQ